MLAVIRILLKILLCLFTALLLVFYLRLGWFWQIITFLSFLAAFYFTRKERQSMSSPWSGAALTVLLFLLSGYGLIEFVVFQSKVITYRMRWSIESSGVDENETDVILRYAEYPGYYSQERSTELAAYLKRSGKPELPVKTRYSFHLWCPAGYQIIQIGELQHWKSSGGSSGYGGARSPHPKPGWWCP